MKLLSIETSSSAGNICLAEDDRIVEQRFLGEGMIHGRMLIPSIDEAIQSQGWAKSDLDAVSVSIGPGSFTGVRVGLAAAKMLAWAGNLKLAGIPTLDILAENAPPEAQHVCPVTDARRNEINACLYHKEDGAWTPRWEHQTHKANALMERLPQGAFLLGDALKAYPHELSTRSDLILLPEEDWKPRASKAAKLGLKKIRNGKLDSPMTLAPIYLRLPPVVERLG